MNKQAIIERIKTRWCINCARRKMEKTSERGANENVCRIAVQMTSCAICGMKLPKEIDTKNIMCKGYAKA